MLSHLMRHIPNAISAMRILLAGVFVIMYSKGLESACLITLIVSFASDVIDGYLARKLKCTSDLGKVLDPLADKLMLLTVLYCLYYNKQISLLIPLVATTKEGLQILFSVLLIKKQVIVCADMFGKATAVAFNAGILLFFLEGNLPFLTELYMRRALFNTATLLSIYTFIHYTVKYGMLALRKHGRD